MSIHPVKKEKYRLISSPENQLFLNQSQKMPVNDEFIKSFPVILNMIQALPHKKGLGRLRKKGTLFWGTASLTPEAYPRSGRTAPGSTQ